ncbi:hypothetical protein EJB05_23049, partial [Eragrostis curvula]
LLIQGLILNAQHASGIGDLSHMKKTPPKKTVMCPIKMEESLRLSMDAHLNDGS